MLKNRHRIKKKESKEVIENIESSLGCNIDGIIEFAEYKNRKLILIDGKICGFFIEGNPFLNVLGLKRWKPSKKYVMVDEGAIKFILNGADVMAPGIVKADEEIQKGDAVWIKDMRDMPIAVGIALIDGMEMMRADKGKAVRNIHHIGDEIWKLSKDF
ncbi:MAG TPA: DUF1947 domain-containing protein [Thermoplasmatales archaeon]|nr:DUF1947 domain-containing protein [Thermoplasmatales archaeon]